MLHVLRLCVTEDHLQFGVDVPHDRRSSRFVRYRWHDKQTKWSPWRPPNCEAEGLFRRATGNSTFPLGKLLLSVSENATSQFIVDKGSPLVHVGESSDIRWGGRQSAKTHCLRNRAGTTDHARCFIGSFCFHPVFVRVTVHDTTAVLVAGRAQWFSGLSCTITTVTTVLYHTVGHTT